MYDATFVLAVIGALFGGINLAFILKIIFNDLHEIRQILLVEIRQILVRHLEEHGKK